MRTIRLSGQKDLFFFKDDRGTLWEVGRDGKPEHPTQKPVGLARRALLNSTEEEDVVLDLFGGSGSTLLAAEVTGRTGYVMELDHGYCQVIISRWERLTGKKAKKII